MNFVEYEYKAPSYEKVVRPYQYAINEDEVNAESRFFQENGFWRGGTVNKNEISLIFAGDLLCQENMMSRCMTKDGRYDFTASFACLRPLFKAADFVAGNLETPISEEAPYRGEIITHEGPFFCNAPMEYLAALKYAGFDMLTTANNHTMDAGAKGVFDTIENTKKFGFIQTGTFCGPQDKYVIVDICGFKVGFTAFGTTYNLMGKNLTPLGQETLLNTYSKEAAERLYTEMKDKGAEYVICFPHWGEEYTTEVSRRQKSMAEQLTKIGYDLIAGSHSHMVQPFEMINDKPVLYSMGNLMSHINLNKRVMDSQYPVLLHLTLTRKNDDIEAKVDFIPCKIFKSLNRIPFAAVPLNEKIKFGKNLSTRMEETTERVCQMLGVGEEMMNLHYPIDEEILDEFQSFKQTYKERLEQFCPVPLKEESSFDAEGEELDEVLDLDMELEIKGWRSLFQKPEFADTETRNGKYTISEGKRKMLYLDAKTTVVKLDQEVKGLPVTVIANHHRCNDTARIIYVGKHVEVIERRAFCNFSALESVRFFDSLRVIKEEAFLNCSRLTGIILPKDLMEIGPRAFSNCPQLLSVKIPKSVNKISGDAFEGSEKVTIYCEEGSYAASYAKRHDIPVKYMPLP